MRAATLDAAESQAASALDLYHAAFEASPIPVALVSKAIGRPSRVMRANPAFCEFTGFTEAELEIGGMALVTQPEQRDEWATRINHLLRQNGGSLRVEKSYLRKDGSSVPGMAHISVVGADDEESWFVVQILDLTERREVEEQLTRRALRDPLTDLPNRTLLDERLGQAIGRLERTQSLLGVIFIDLDNFKVVNDTLGHRAGDELIRSVGERLTGVVRGSDTVARFGGDEFVVLAEGLFAGSETVALAQRLAAALEAPFKVAGEDYALSASMGIAIGPSPATSPEELIRDADLAMYRAKAAGRGRFEVFDEGMRRSALERLQIEQSLRTAISLDALRVHYQPLMALREETIVGCEALVRWEHPRRGLLRPDEFIAVAEESGEIVAIGEWVLEQACRQAREWREAGTDMAVSVNLSPRQLMHADLVATVDETLRRVGLPAPSLCVEITEGAVIDGMDQAISTLHRLRRLGVRIAMDDFGTGYSSLGYLRELPVDVIKLDRRFIHSVHRNKEDQAIVAAVVSLAKILGLTVVAEGVERRKQVEALRRLGCEFVQGFYFGEPVPAEDLALDGFAARGRPGVGDPLVIREFMRQIGIPARRAT